MFAGSHILLLKINLPKRVSKYSRVVSIPPRVGYRGTYAICMVWYTMYYTAGEKENALITLSAMKIHY